MGRIAIVGVLLVAVAGLVFFVLRDDGGANEGGRQASDAPPANGLGEPESSRRGWTMVGAPQRDGQAAGQSERPELAPGETDTFPAIDATDEMQRQASESVDDGWRRFLAEVPSLGDEDREKVLQVLQDFQRTARAALATYDGDVKEFFRVVVPDLWEETYVRAAEILTPRQLRAFDDWFRTAGTALAVADRLIGASPAPRTVKRDAM